MIKFETLENYADYMIAVKGRAQRTVEEYLIDITMFLQFVATRKNRPVTLDLVRAIRVEDMYAFLSFLTNRKSSASTRVRKICAVRSFFRYLTVSVKLLDKNIMMDIERPKVQPKLPVSLSLVESIMLIKSTDTIQDGFYRVRNNSILIVFLNCGLRISELAGLRIDQIHPDQIVVLGKGNKEGSIYLNQAARTAITNWLDARKGYKSGYLFITKKDSLMTTSAIHRMVKGQMTAIGLDPHKYSTHKLRHTAATLMYQYGNTDIRVLQKFLRHSSIASTQIYTHVSDKQLQSAANNNPLSSIA